MKFSPVTSLDCLIFYEAHLLTLWSSPINFMEQAGSMFGIRTKLLSAFL